MSIILMVYLASKTGRNNHETLAADRRQRFKSVVQAEARQHGGRVLQILGNRALVTFTQGDPITCTDVLRTQLSDATLAPIQVLHAGVIQGRDVLSDDEVLHKLLSLQEIAWPGQVLASAEAAQICRLPQGFVLRDLGVHLLLDLTEPQRVYQVTSLTAPAEAFPPLRSLSQYQHNLPSHRIPFVGREEELQRIVSFFREQGGRWLTLLGPGGIGKTRLALQAGALLVPDFEDGVFRVSMGHLGSLTTFLIALADAMRFTFYGREDLHQQMITYLRHKHMLLILDSCDRFLEAQAWLSELQNTAPRLSVLATARERLHAAQETVMELGGLQLPDPERGLTLEKASATRLFLQCVRQNAPAYWPSPEEASAIERICRLLGGLPMGIELAAAWVGALTCQDIAEELEGNLDFLEPNLPGPSAQERSLRGQFTSAWALLGKSLQKTLIALTIFPANFAAEDAIAITGCPPEHLPTLADKSMLKKVDAGRYEFHRVLHQYTQEKATRQEVQQLQQRFMHHYLGRLAASREALRDQRQLQTLETLGLERDNLLQAWRWALQYRELELLRQALPPLAQFLDMRGLWQEAVQLVQQVLQSLWGGGVPPENEEQLAAAVFSALGFFALRMGQHQQAETWLRRALELFAQHDDPEGMADVLHRLGDAAYSQGDYETAQAHYRRAFELYTQMNDLWGQMVVLNNWANLLLNLGRREEAKAYYERCLRYSEQLGEQWIRSAALSNLGNELAYEGDFETALKLNQEALVIKRTFRGRMGIAIGLLNLGTLYNALNKHIIAESFLKESLTIYREIGDWRGLAAAYEEIGYTYSHLQRHEEALEALGESLRLRRLMNDRWGIASALRGVAHGLIQSGAHHLAIDYLHEAWQTLLTVDAPPMQMAVLIEYAAALIAQKDYVQAYRILEVVLRQPLDAFNRLHAQELKEQLSQRLTEEQMAQVQQQAAQLKLSDIGAALGVEAT